MSKSELQSKSSTLFEHLKTKLKFGTQGLSLFLIIMPNIRIIIYVEKSLQQKHVGNTKKNTVKITKSCVYYFDII